MEEIDFKTSLKHGGRHLRPVVRSSSYLDTVTHSRATGLKLNDQHRHSWKIPLTSVCQRQEGLKSLCCEICFLKHNFAL